MRSLPPAFALVLVVFSTTSNADIGSDVHTAITALANTRYAWETTTRQRFSGDSTEPRVILKAPIEVEGRTDPNGYTQITVMPSRELAVPVMAIFRHGDVVCHTPIGWLRRTEMRQVPGTDRVVEFEGKQVRLARVFSVALRASAARTPAEELLDLLADVKSYRTVSGLMLAELNDRVVERLWGDERAKRAPEIQGNVIFKLTGEQLNEHHVVLAIGFPNSRTKKIAWSMTQWSTRISGIGSTVIEPPPAAVKALAD